MLQPHIKKKILELIAEELQVKGYMMLNHLTPVLLANGFTREIYEGAKPKNWLRANFPEISFEGDPGRELLVLQSTPAPEIPPKEVRRQYTQILSEQLEMQGMVLHSAIPQLLPDWSRYRIGSERLGAWLARVFPETVFVTRTVNNAAALFTPQAAQQIASIVELAQRQLGENGCPVAALEAALEAEQAPWASVPVPHNQTLGEWLIDHIPGLGYTDEAQTFLKPGAAARGVSRGLTDAEKQAAVLRFAYLPATGAQLTALREALEDPTYTTAAWRKRSVDLCFDSLLGIGDGFLDDSDAAEPRMAFYTGLQSASGRHIYCILQPNPASPPWRGDVFRYPGQNDPEGLGKWLCRRFGLPSEDPEHTSTALRTAGATLERLDALQPELSRQFPAAAEAVRTGEPVAEEFAALLEQYRDCWSELLRACPELGLETDRPGLTERVRELMNRKDDPGAVLTAARAEYERLVRGAWDYMIDRAGLAAEDNLQEDLLRWDEAVASRAGAEAIRAAEGLTGVFAAMQTLSRASLPLNEEAKSAWTLVENHFCASMRVVEIRKYFIDAPEEELGFLNALEELRRCMSRLELHSAPQNPVRTAVPTDEALLQQVLAGVGVCLIRDCFPAPNAFEAAVMGGALERAQQLAADGSAMAELGYDELERTAVAQKLGGLFANFSQPVLAAGIHLEALQGNRNRQAEKCLLVALALQEGDAAQRLMELYASEGRTELLRLLYAAFGKQLSPAQRGRYLPELLSAGLLTAQRVVDEDILGFLSMEQTAARHALSQTLQDRLQQLDEALQTEFVRHAVFADSALYNYIRQPEKLEQLRPEGIGHTAESLAELLRSGSYPRGQDALSTARRAWAFLGDWQAVAEHFARLAADPEGRSGLLWQIARFRNDRGAMLALMEEYPNLLRQHQAVCADLLYESGDWRACYDLLSRQEQPQLRLQLQRTTAAVRLGLEAELNGLLSRPEELAGEAELLIGLACALAQTGREGQLAQLLCACFDSAMHLCPGQTVQRLVTADGAAGEALLAQLQTAALEAEQTGLAVYIQRALGVGNVGQQADACLQRLLEQAEGEDHVLCTSALNALQQLFPEEFARRYARLFPALLRCRAETAEAAARLLQPELLREDTLGSILNALKDRGIADHPAITQALLERCADAGLRRLCLDFYHTHADAFGGRTDGLLCRLYRQALEEGTFPRERLEEAEAVVLRLLRHCSDADAARCLRHIEQQLERSARLDFVRLYLEEDVGEECSELSLLRRILEDKAADIGDYLYFCGSFGLCTGQDRQAAAAAAEQTAGALTEAESLPVLRALYDDPADPTYLAAASKLPLRDLPAAYGRLLFFGANQGGKGITWSGCASYCEKFRLDDLLVRSLLGWMRQNLDSSTQNLAWYSAKECFNLIRSLCSRSEGFPSLEEPQLLTELMEELCTFFLRIDADSVDGSNHTSLRSMVELAVLSGTEEVLLSRLAEKLAGSYRKLGLVLACRLLLRGSYAAALEQLRTLERSYGQMIYRQLVTQLAAMEAEDLPQWVQQDTNRLLLESFVLPDGNLPDSGRLRTFVMQCLMQERQETGIRVIEQLLDYFGSDVLCYKSLFLLCKDRAQDHLPQLYRALRGLYTYYPVDKRTFYTRDREAVLGLLAAFSALYPTVGFANAEALSDFIHSGSLLSDQDRSRLIRSSTQYYRDIGNLFVGISDPAQQELTRLGLLACITGHWADFFTAAFESECEPDELAGLLSRVCTNYWGLARGLLLALRRQDETRQEEFSRWYKAGRAALNQLAARMSEEDAASARARFLTDGPVRAMQTVETILTHNDIQVLEPAFLSLPLEEHFLCLGESWSFEGAVDSCYRWMWEQFAHTGREAEADAMLQVFMRLGQDSARILRLYMHAEEAMRQGRYALVNRIYLALDSIRAIPKNVSGATKALRDNLQCIYHEVYESRSRICRLLLEDPEMITKAATMKVHSCANMLVTLVDLQQLELIPRIAPYFVGVNRKLCADLPVLLNTRVDDARKLELLQSYDAPMLLRSGVEAPDKADSRSEEAQAVLSRILSQRSKATKLLLFVRPQLGRQMEDRYAALSQRSARLRKFVLCPEAAPDPDALERVAEELTRLNESQWNERTADAGDEDFLPAFLRTMPEENAASLPSAEALRAALTQCPFDDYEGRMVCTRCLYLRAVEDGAAPGAQAAALVQYGLAWRSYQLSCVTGEGDASDAQARAAARQALLDLARFCSIEQRRSGTVQTAVPFADGLRSILHDDFASIHELLEDYRRNREGYNALARQNTDRSVQQILDTVLSVIRQLAAHHEQAGPLEQNTASYRNAYKAAYEELERAPFHLNWNGVKNTLLQHLMRAINDLDKRPYLEVRVLNDDAEPRCGHIHGTLTNIGRVSAEQITLQAIWGGGALSDTLGYRELAPGEQICFAVAFAAPVGAQNLSYTLNVSCRHKEKEYVSDPISGQLELTEEQHFVPDVDLYDSRQSLTFRTNEQGEVQTRGFYGRKSEKEQLEQAAPAGGEFGSYRSVVVQGFRRTGKTSLLNYLVAHIRGKCGEKALAVYVDCEGISEQPIQKIFVSAVIHGAEARLPQLSGSEGWEKLKQAWMLAPGAPDRDPDSLQFFYPALSRVLEGRGVVLIVDEVDRLFERLEHSGDAGTASSLFPALRAVQTNPDCRESVRLVFCGSNNMLIYNQDGGRLHQLFQTFATIPVGQLRKEDVSQLLTDPFAADGRMEYHPEAIEWIWRCTGGLVWYTKLLANATVAQAQKHHRRMIYPIDVSLAFDSIINEQNCKQYIDEGCSDADRLVLDAMATASVHRGGEVSREQLAAMLKELTPAQLDGSLRLLTDTLHLLERTPGRSSYRFAVEIYRRFYRILPSRFPRTEGQTERMQIVSLADAEGVRSHRKRRS